MAEVVIKVKSEGADKAEKDINALNKSLGQTTKQTEAVTKGSDKMAEGFAAADEATGGLIKSMKALLANPVVAIIAGIVAALGAFKAALNSTADGQEEWAAAMAQVSGFINTLTTFISENLVKSVKDAGGVFNWLWDQILGGIKLVTTPLRAMINAVARLAEGDIKGAATAYVDTFVEAYETVADAIVKTVEATKEAIELAAKNAALAENLARQEAQLTKDKRENLVTQSKLNRQLQEQRALSADATKSSTERLVAINKAFAISSKMAADNIEQAKEELRIAREKAALASNTIEDNDKIAQLEANINNLYAQRDSMQREMLGTRATLIAQIEAEKKAMLESSATILQQSNEIQASMNQEAYDNEVYMQELRVALMEDGINKEVELLKMKQAAELQALEERNMSLEEYEEAAALIKQNYANQEVALRQATEAQKENATETYMAGASKLMGQFAGESKAAAYAQAIINTYLAASGALADTKGGIVARIVAFTTAITTGLMAVRNIAKTKTPGNSGGVGSATVSGASVPAAVNQAPALTQLNQSQEVRAYIVEDDLQKSNTTLQNRKNNTTL